MPELPEVETIRRNLTKWVIGKQIDQVIVHLPRIIRQPSIELFQNHLQGTTIHRVDRRGKFLKFICEPWILISHLRMEGKYRMALKDEPLEKHTHVIFSFTDGTELRYLDVRQFGTMDLLPLGVEDQNPPLCHLGVEPLSESFTLEWLKERIVKRKTKIKSLLLNQEWIVGLGNIYVDEILFRAGIHPERIACSLTQDQIEMLYSQIREVLTKAIEAGGSSVRTYVNGEGEKGQFQMQIQVYGKKDQACVRCGNLIKRIVVAGRGTHLCETCQQ